MYSDRRFIPAMAQDAFEESAHPRDHGKFSSGSGGGKEDLGEKFRGYKSKYMGQGWNDHAEAAPELAAKYIEALNSSDDPGNQRKAVLAVKKTLMNTPGVHLGHAEGLADIVLGHSKANYGSVAPVSAKEAGIKQMSRYLKDKVGHK